MLIVLKKKLVLYSSSFFLFFFCIFFNHQAFSLNKSSLSPTLNQSLEVLLSMMGQVHEAVKSSDVKKFQLQINKMSKELGHIRVFGERSLAYHEKAYLHRQVQRIKEYLSIIALNQTQIKKNLSQIKNLNRELIYISRAYDLNRNKTQYGFYFCPKDDSVWIQKAGTKVYHPFKENYRSCGRKIH